MDLLLEILIAVVIGFLPPLIATWLMRGYYPGVPEFLLGWALCAALLFWVGRAWL